MLFIALATNVTRRRRAKKIEAVAATAISLLYSSDNCGYTPACICGGCGGGVGVGGRTVEGRSHTDSCNSLLEQASLAACHSGTSPTEDLESTLSYFTGPPPSYSSHLIPLLSVNLVVSRWTARMGAYEEE